MTPELRERLVDAAFSAAGRVNGNDESRVPLGWAPVITEAVDAILAEIERAGMVVVEAAMVERLRALAEAAHDQFGGGQYVPSNTVSVSLEVAIDAITHADLGHAEESRT